MTHNNPMTALYDRLQQCEQRLFQAEGFLSVLNQAMALKQVRGTADEDERGYSEVIEHVQSLLCEVSQDVETMQGTLYPHGSSD